MPRSSPIRTSTGVLGAFSPPPLAALCRRSTSTPPPGGGTPPPGGGTPPPGGGTPPPGGSAGPRSTNRGPAEVAPVRANPRRGALRSVTAYAATERSAPRLRRGIKNSTGRLGGQSQAVGVDPPDQLIWPFTSSAWPVRIHWIRVGRGRGFRLVHIGTHGIGAAQTGTTHGCMPVSSP